MIDLASAIGYYTGLIGVWIMSDGMYSWALYYNSKGYKGECQTFWKDHWIRMVRILAGIALIFVGYLSIAS